MRGLGYMTTTDTFIRQAVDQCMPTRSVAEKFKWRKVLAQSLSDRANGVEGRSVWPEDPREAQKAQLVVVYNRILHKHIREECVL